nr:gamma-glutamylcyclotransferase family protein [Synechococcus sp. MU1625]
MLKVTKRDRDGIVDGFFEIQHHGYPMLKRGDGAISGEVYWVPEPCWPDLDDWEEVPEVYQRTNVILRDGRSVWLYEAAQGNLQQIPPQSFQHPP